VNGSDYKLTVGGESTTVTAAQGTSSEGSGMGGFGGQGNMPGGKGGRN